MIKKENAITLIALVITIIAKYGKNSKKACNLGKKLI